MKKYIAETISTMILVLLGFGTAVFSGDIAGTVVAGVGTIRVAPAFGLPVVAMAYTIRGESGCHINPVTTLGALLTNRICAKDTGIYVVFQILRAIIGPALPDILVSTGALQGTTATGANSFGERMMLQAFVAAVVFTFIFALVVLGSTDEKKGAGNWGGLAIGLILVHIVYIPITGTSVNPARSTGPALLQGGEALSQLWLFIIALSIGAIASALAWKVLTSDKNDNFKS